ncbi:MAG: flagellar motor protein MotB [Prolixibacteraceae bacterium]
MKTITITLLTVLLFSSCVSKKLLVEKQSQYDQALNGKKTCEQKNSELSLENKKLSESNRKFENDLISCETNLNNERNRINMQEQQLEYFKNTNSNMLDLLTDLSVVNKTGAESIKKSLEAINEQNNYIKDLTSSIRKRDSLNLALVVNLKKSLLDVNDEDVTVEVKKGVVYISLSDKLLYKSGSAEISSKAEAVLGKIARVLNDHKDLEILVEGHTDNVPIATECFSDNWDLSVKRSTTVVRLLQSKFNISPERMTAGGRSQYSPKAGNDTLDGKALNRRTEIIILPNLEQFFQLLEPNSQN